MAIAMIDRMRGGDKTRAKENIGGWLWDKVKDENIPPTKPSLSDLQDLCLPTDDIIRWWRTSKKRIVGKYVDGDDHKKNAGRHIIQYLRYDSEPNIPDLHELMKKCMLTGDELQSIIAKWKKRHPREAAMAEKAELQ